MEATVKVGSKVVSATVDVDPDDVEASVDV